MIEDRFKGRCSDGRIYSGVPSSKRSTSFTSLVARERCGKLIGGQNGSDNGILAKFLESILGVAEHTHQLLADEIERRANLEEEQRLANEQGMYMPFSFEWEFIMGNR